MSSRLTTLLVVMIRTHFPPLLFLPVRNLAVIEIFNIRVLRKNSVDSIRPSQPNNTHNAVASTIVLVRISNLNSMKLNLVPLGSESIVCIDLVVMLRPDVILQFLLALRLFSETIRSMGLSQRH